MYKKTAFVYQNAEELFWCYSNVYSQTSISLETNNDNAWCNLK